MRLSFVTAALFFGVGIRAQANQYAFILTGDSTTAINNGWGTGFCNDLLSGVNCVITAHNGATTQSFVNDGYWNTTLSNLRTQLSAGRKVYVTMQFGHNDQKVAPAETMGTNLKKMIDDLRNTQKSVGKGSVEPVLVTSLTRRNFNSDGSINDTLGPWADMTISVSKEKSTALLDLHKDSIRYCTAIGADASHRLNFEPTDNTHLNANGAIVFGRMIADLFKVAYPSTSLPFTSDPTLSYNIAHGIPSF